MEKLSPIRKENVKSETDIYLNIFGFEIRQAILDFLKFHSKKGIKNYEILIFDDAKDYIFSPRRLEAKIAAYGLDSELDVGFIRSQTMRMLLTGETMYDKEINQGDQTKGLRNKGRGAKIRRFSDRGDIDYLPVIRSNLHQSR